jgi:ureidoglycolate hydrolase
MTGRLRRRAVTALEVRSLPIQHLRRTAFEPFGVIVEPETADSPTLNRAPGNLGFLWVQKALEFPKQPYICTLRYYYRSMRCEFMQKHPASTVVLIPLGYRPSVFYVAPEAGGDKPDIDHAAAFLLEGGRGVVLHRGTWVRYAYPLGRYADFAYITQRVDPATANVSDDVVRFRLDADLGLVFDVEFPRPNVEGIQVGPGGAVIAGPSRNPPFE